MSWQVEVPVCDGAGLVLAWNYADADKERGARGATRAGGVALESPAEAAQARTARRHHGSLPVAMAMGVGPARGLPLEDNSEPRPEISDVAAIARTAPAWGIWAVRGNANSSLDWRGSGGMSDADSGDAVMAVCLKNRAGGQLGGSYAALAAAEEQDDATRVVGAAPTVSTVQVLDRDGHVIAFSAQVVAGRGPAAVSGVHAASPSEAALLRPSDSGYTVAPEPSCLAMFAMGLALLGRLRRRRRLG